MHWFFGGSSQRPPQPQPSPTPTLNWIEVKRLVLAQVPYEVEISFVPAAMIATATLQVAANLNYKGLTEAQVANRLVRKLRETVK